jgi:hypothetical protein
MIALGYARDKVDETYVELFKLNLFHEDPISLFQERRVTPIVIHERSTEAYMDLATRPEYLLAIAQVTPVDEDAFNRMHTIDVTTDNTFLRDTLKCLEFIEFVRRAEDEFAKGIGEHQKDEIPLPILWNRMSSNYFDRLTRLRKSGLLSSVGFGDWLSILSHSVFSQVRHH